MSLPQFLSVRLIRGSLVDQFRGMIDEIERRDVVRRNASEKEIEGMKFESMKFVQVQKP
jgi:hypothetical protein